MPIGGNGGKPPSSPSIPIHKVLTDVLAKSRTRSYNNTETDRWYQTLLGESRNVLDTGVQSIIAEALHRVGSKAYDTALKKNRSPENKNTAKTQTTKSAKNHPRSLNSAASVTNRPHPRTQEKSDRNSMVKLAANKQHNPSSSNLYRPPPPLHYNLPPPDPYYGERHCRSHSENYHNDRGVHQLGWDVRNEYRYRDDDHRHRSRSRSYYEDDYPAYDHHHHRRPPPLPPHDMRQHDTSRDRIPERSRSRRSSRSPSENYRNRYASAGKEEYYSTHRNDRSRRDSSISSSRQQHYQPLHRPYNDDHPRSPRRHDSFQNDSDTTVDHNCNLVSNELPGNNQNSKYEEPSTPRSNSSRKSSKHSSGRNHHHHHHSYPRRSRRRSRSLSPSENSDSNDSDNWNQDDESRSRRRRRKSSPRKRHSGDSSSSDESRSQRRRRKKHHKQQLPQQQPQQFQHRHDSSPENEANLQPRKPSSSSKKKRKRDKSSSSKKSMPPPLSIKDADYEEPIL